MPALTPYATVSAKEIDDIISSLKWVTSIPYAKRAFDLSRIKQRLLEFVKSNFPVADEEDRRNRANAPHLVTGFRTYDIPGLQDKVGFVLQHRDINNLRTREILQALELGSRGYYRRPASSFVAKDGRTVGVFSFIPGDHRGVRNPTGGVDADFATTTRLHIPARRGIHVMSKSFQFAQDLISQAKPEYFRKLQSSFRSREK